MEQAFLILFAFGAGLVVGFLKFRVKITWNKEEHSLSLVGWATSESEKSLAEFVKFIKEYYKEKNKK